MRKKEKIELLEKANDALVHLNADLIEKVKTMESFVYEMPDDCVMGKHCEICVHKKVFHVNTTKKTWAPGYDLTRVVLCGKHMTCKGFATDYVEKLEEADQVIE